MLQGWFGHPGRLISEVVVEEFEPPLDKLQVWAKPMAEPSSAKPAVAVFVLNYVAVSQNVTVDFAKLPWLKSKVGGLVSVRDVWMRKSLRSTTKDNLQVALHGYDSALLMLQM